MRTKGVVVMRKGGRSVSGTMAMVIVLIIGVVFIAVSIFAISSYQHLQKVCTGKVYGTVIDLVERRSTSTSNGHRRTSYSYAPVVQFMVNGREYTVESNTSTNPPSHQVGDTIEVHYNPDNPEETYFEKDAVALILGVVFGVIGFALIIIPAIVLVLFKTGVI